MKKWLASALLLAGISVSQAATMPVGVASRGEQIANSVCAACHGPNGDSSSTGIPRLAGQHRTYIYKQLKDFKSGLRQNVVMGAQVASLSDQQMSDLAAYYAGTKGKVTAAEPNTVAFAQKLYLGGDGSKGKVPCAGCHGPKGSGNGPALFPKIGGQRPDYIKAQLLAFRASGRDDLGAPAYRRNDTTKTDAKGPMQQVASRLADKDIEYLSNYIGGLH